MRPPYSRGLTSQDACQYAVRGALKLRGAGVSRNETPSVSHSDKVGVVSGPGVAKKKNFFLRGGSGHEGRGDRWGGLGGGARFRPSPHRPTRGGRGGVTPRARPPP